MNAIADLDRQDCDAFTALCRFCWWVRGTPSPLVFEPETYPIYSEHGVHYGTLRHLQSIGLIELTGPHIGISWHLEQPEIATYFGEKFQLDLSTQQHRRTPDPGTVNAGKVSLTLIGKELMPISGAESLPAFREFMLRHWSDILKPAPAL